MLWKSRSLPQPREGLSYGLGCCQRGSYLLGTPAFAESIFCPNLVPPLIGQIVNRHLGLWTLSRRMGMESEASIPIAKIILPLK